MKLMPPGAKLENKCAARIVLTLPFYEPMRHANKIECPVLLVAAVQDSLIPIDAVRKAAARIPNAKLVELDCPHFEPYVGAWFEKSVAAQVAFLKELFPSTVEEQAASTAT
jgi:pimeloyl-ACP methyl ester carboxylesterase